MNINIICAGLIKDNNLISLIDDYLKRITLFKITITQVDAKNLTATQVDEKLLAKVKPSPYNYVILLDEKGKQYSSVDFANTVNELNTNYKYIYFLIGGNEGFTQNTKKQANALISLGNLTYPHKIARLLIAEQLYRAQSILLNQPYHKIGF